MPSRNLLLLLLALISASACSPLSTETPFIPPTALPQLIEPTLIIKPTQNIVVVQTTPLPTILIPTATLNPADCVNNLIFVEDLTIPDNTPIAYGATLDKQWLVQNSGTCDWDSTYRLKWIGGDPMGAAQEQPLYPARAGTQATLRILFTAPATEGPYESAWQAYDPEGNSFGDPIFIKIVVIGG